MDSKIELELRMGLSAYHHFNVLIAESPTNPNDSIEDKINKKKEIFKEIKRGYFAVLDSDLDNRFRNQLEPIILYFCGVDGTKYLKSFKTGKLNRFRAIDFFDYCDEIERFFNGNSELNEMFDDIFRSLLVKPLYDFKLNYLEATNELGVILHREEFDYVTGLKKYLFLHRKHQKGDASVKTRKKREQELLKHINIDPEYAGEYEFGTEETLQFYECLLEKSNGESGSTYPLKFMRSNLYHICKENAQSKSERALLIDLFELLPYHNPFRDYYFENSRRIAKSEFQEIYGDKEKYKNEEKYKMAHSYFALSID